MTTDELQERNLEHFEAVIEKDIDTILATYAESKDLLVFVEGPRWATLGYQNVEKGWRDFVDADISVSECNWIEHKHSKIVGNMGFLAGIVELKTTIAGQEKTIKFRGTFVFEKNGAGEWKVVHEHFSQPAEDPYGIGDWLKKD